MRVAICSSFVPFIHGGGRFIVEWLATKLRESGHQVEAVYLPFVEINEQILPQFLSYRLMDLSQNVDRLITIRAPAHLIPHPNKKVWFIHHIRLFYDLWESPYRKFPDDERHRGLRRQIMEADQTALREARQVFTNSQVVSRRLQTYNKIESEVLYPPLLEPERFHCREYGDEVVYLSRVEHHKRQHLLIEAFRYVKTPVKLRLCGVSSNSSYVLQLRLQITRHQLLGRVSFENRWVSEEEKSELLAGALCSAYLPQDEDSYGYPSLESSSAEKAVLTTTDSGGVTELVKDRYNGRVVEPEPKALASAIDELYENRELARQMGQAARLRLTELNINWDHVLTRLLS